MDSGGNGAQYVCMCIFVCIYLVGMTFLWINATGNHVTDCALSHNVHMQNLPGTWTVK